MRIVIVGCGKVGTTLAEQLNREKHEIVLIEKNPEVLQGVTNTLDLIGVAGNGASDAVLREAGAATADLLIAVTTTDELNLLCCLIAKKVGVRNTIARVRNPEYSQEILNAGSYANYAIDTSFHLPENGKYKGWTLPGGGASLRLTDPVESVKSLHEWIYS